MDSRRILITGLASTWGGRLAQMLEAEPGVEAIIGIDAVEPRHALERTEFVRVDTEPGTLRRILRAAAIDTAIDTRLHDDPTSGSEQRARAVNVTGTRNLLAACEAPDSPVRKLVFKSSAHIYGCGPRDPAFFAEEMERVGPPRTAFERDLLEAERSVTEFAVRNRLRTTTVLRFADPVGAGLGGALLTLLSLPVVPGILGFDPRCQLIHEDDVVRVLAHAARHDLPGVFNAAADGVLVLSEVSSLLGKPLMPVLPPWGTETAAIQLRRLGLRVPVELLRQLRFGRGLDNRRLKATGYQYRYTTREALLKLRAHQRLRPLLRAGGEEYRYEREVEEFLRRSPSVRSLQAGPPESIAAGFNGLGATELIELISSLEPEALQSLREYEATHEARASVLDALDRNLARRAQD